MTTIATPIPLTVESTDAATRRHHPAARRGPRFRDGKLAAIAAVESLARCGRRDLEVLGASADLVRVPAGTVLAEGWGLARQWWMPVEGWLLAEGDTAVARTVPAGASWVAPRLPAVNGRLVSLRDSQVLVAPVARLQSTLVDHPRLGAAIRSTLVGGDV